VPPIVAIALLLGPLGLLADGPDKPSAPSESSARHDAVVRVLVDESRPLDERASIALDEAAALDREAQASPSAEGRRGRSAMAVRLLDNFNTTHPRHGFETPLALQSAVYVWADGRRDLEEWRQAPGEDAKARAIGRLDESIRRLDALGPALSGTDPLVAQNARFRLAQALADRAALDPDASPAGRVRLAKALAALDPVPTESSVEGFARLLRAETLARLGDLVRAEGELEAAEKMKPPPPAGPLAEVRTRILTTRRRYREAIQAIDASGLDEVARAAMAVEVRLAQRSNESSGSARRDAEADAFARAKLLRGSDRPEAREARAHLARALDGPPPHSDPEAWDMLGESALTLGDAARASRLVAEGADRADSLHHPEEAARLRLRAGAILFQSGDYAGADPLLGRAFESPAGGPWRPRAAMLRALARGRALTENRPGADRTGYVAALRDAIRAFPDDPATAEARWLLAAVEAEDGRVSEAISLWRSIPPGHPRWLSARLAVTAENQRALDDLRAGDDTTALRARFRDAAAFLRESSRQAVDPSDIVELDLASVRLDLTPGVGRPELARSLCDRLAHAAASPAQLARARVLRLVALAETQRIAEAEKEIAAAVKDAPPADLVLAARLLDDAASAVETDVNRIRLGRLTRAITDGLARDGRVPAPLAADLKLRAVRAAIFAGDPEGARRLLRAEPALDPSGFDVNGLRDLSDAFLRLEAPALAVEVERLRGRRLATGSHAWLESRYTLALALYRDGKAVDARALIDATAILHPDLGGALLRPRFERLRQRIDEP
jgi:tetratricopeptide (TPR) repeat protein